CKIAEPVRGSYRRLRPLFSSRAAGRRWLTLSFGALSMTSRIPPALPPLIPLGPPPVISPRPGVILANRLWCGFLGFLHLAVLIWTVLELSGVVEPPTGLIDELVTPKEGPAREALMAEKRRESREIAPLLITTSVIGLGFYCFACFAPRRKSGWAVG